MEYKIAIIGGGAGGVFASCMASFFGLKHIVLEKNTYLGGQVMELYAYKPVYDFPSYQEILAGELMQRLIKQQQKSSYQTTWCNCNITTITKNTKCFKIQTNQGMIVCTNIILATGFGSFQPIPLIVQNQKIQAANIHYSINQNLNLYVNKRLVILGGGDSAIETANYLAQNKLSNDITLIHRRYEYRCQSHMVMALEQNMIKQKRNFRISALCQNQQLITITHNQTNQEEVIAYDYLIIQYGKIPKPQFFPLFQTCLQKNKYVVDQNQKTAIKHAYAIGDATHYDHRANTLLSACAEAQSAVWHIVKSQKATSKSDEYGSDATHTSSKNPQSNQLQTRKQKQQ